MGKPELDEVTGVYTTGHEWDGIKELNTPMPRWWIWSFYACILFSVGYWVVYPSWPTLNGYAKGVWNITERGKHMADLEARKAEQAPWNDRIAAMSVDEIAADSDLLAYTMAGGRVIFAENCQGCHGSEGSGAPTYPILADNDWLWGGTRSDIYQTVQYGIRSDHDETRASEMPMFSDDYLSAEQISDTAEYVLSLSGKSTDTAAATRGSAVFLEECTACHGEGGVGIQEMGGPKLADEIWFYGSNKADLVTQISKPRHGVMPAWVDRLSDVEIKQIVLYVHSQLGGGQ